MRKADVIFYKLSQLSTNDPTLNDPKKVTEIAAVNNIGAATNTSKNPPKNPATSPLAAFLAPYLLIPNNLNKLSATKSSKCIGLPCK